MDRKRARKVTFRMSEAEYEKLEMMADKSGKSISDTCRTLISDTVIQEKSFSEEQKKELLGQLGHIGANLNQIAKRLNEGSTPVEEQALLKRIFDAYVYLWKQVKAWHI